MEKGAQRRIVERLKKVGHLHAASRGAKILRTRELIEHEEPRRPAGGKTLKLTVEINIGKNIGGR